MCEALCIQHLLREGPVQRDVKQGSDTRHELTDAKFAGWSGMSHHAARRPGLRRAPAGEDVAGSAERPPGSKNLKRLRLQLALPALIECTPAPLAPLELQHPFVVRADRVQDEDAMVGRRLVPRRENSAFLILPRQRHTRDSRGAPTPSVHQAAQAAVDPPGGDPQLGDGARGLWGHAPGSSAVASTGSLNHRPRRRAPAHAGRAQSPAGPHLGAKQAVV